MKSVLDVNQRLLIIWYKFGALSRLVQKMTRPLINQVMVTTRFRKLEGVPEETFIKRCTDDISNNLSDSILGQFHNPTKPDVICDDWMMPSNFDLFDHESAIRKSISEKRGDEVTRFFLNGEGPKTLKAKHKNGNKTAESKEVHFSSPLPENKSNSNLKISNHSSSAESYQNRSSQLNHEASSQTLVTVVTLNSPETPGDETDSFRKSSSTEPTAPTDDADQQTTSVNNQKPCVESTLSKSSSMKNIPKATLKAFRGKATNDSLKLTRQRLRNNCCYEISDDIVVVEQAETVPEDKDLGVSAAPSSENQPKLKHPEGNGKKLFGLFKIKKPKSSPEADRKAKKNKHQFKSRKDSERTKKKNESGKKTSGHQRNGFAGSGFRFLVALAILLPFSFVKVENLFYF